MPQMTLPALQAMLSARRADALAASSAARLSEQRAAALDYYLGEMSDLPAEPGRSHAVSTDVADTVEGLMPTLMDVFAGSDEVVRFNPVGPEDVEAAEQETDYVNHVFMQQNPGFMVLYGFIKDALLSKVGIVKVWWEERDEESRETYLDQDDGAFALIAADPDVEIVEHSMRDDPSRPASPDADPALSPKLHDVTVVARRKQAGVRVEGVPPEEFGIARNARSIQDADYCFHEVTRPEDALIAEGYDAAQLRALAGETGGSRESRARDTVEEGVETESRRVKVTEHYVRMAWHDGEKPALYRVTTAGDEILKRGGKPDIVREDMHRFAAMTPIVMTHRFFGRSIADLVMDIQRIKTTLLRGALDNLYLANNPRVEVAEAHASEATMDDLLVARPGGVVRTRTPGGIIWQTVPDIAGSIYPALQYFDIVREWRTGVSRQGQGLDANALANQTATAVNQVFNAAQARTRLIARIFAETGIRDMFALIHATLRKHANRAATARLRNRWVAVDPRDWKNRNDLTISVGLGTGSKSERVAQLSNLIQLQAQAVAAGKTNLVSDENLFNSAREMVKLLDLKDVERFFSDPRRAAPQQPGPDPQLVQMQAALALQERAAQAEIAAEARKADAAMALAAQRFALEKELKLIDAELKRREREAERIGKAVETASGEGAAQGPGTGAIIAELIAALRQVNAPKRVVRDAQGRVSHVEPMQEHPDPGSSSLTP